MIPREHGLKLRARAQVVMYATIKEREKFKKNSSDKLDKRESNELQESGGKYKVRHFTAFPGFSLCQSEVILSLYSHNSLQNLC